MSDTLPDLPLMAWEPTKDTLHLYTQIVGKIQLASAPPRNHWWHATLRVNESGYGTGRMVHDGVSFGIAFDLVRHRLVVRTPGREEAIPLRDGLSVAEFHDSLFALLRELGVHVKIKAKPFGVPMTTPFADDTEHAAYDRERVEDYRDALLRVDEVFREFRGWFTGKSSPVQLFWHSFDLAMARFSGRAAPPMPEADPVTREAYSRELISFGWWPGDRAVAAPMFYAYAHPEPDGLTAQPLAPDGAAHWEQTGTTHQARLPWDQVRAAADPRGTVLDFLQSAYAAGAITARWPYGDLPSNWCPPRGLVEPSQAAGTSTP
ncbi:DUF5996 family protein [Actinomadura xylanilytica]|uniref:DUF5996 family protein n=1 Tax=Actinomadura xylanilytica TaxID=887459 RepID=UPI00255B0350|nr:DUF5996 family protein [Actinomadura xylanilytica]MDL4774645.1 DUF5996 family protein [Actinomadura xylanilytica]